MQNQSNAQNRLSELEKLQCEVEMWKEAYLRTKAVNENLFAINEEYRSSLKQSQTQTRQILVYAHRLVEKIDIEDWRMQALFLTAMTSYN